MADSEGLAKLREGVAVWNEWRKGYVGRLYFNRVDFKGARFSGANFNATDFIGANLIEADLSGANLNAAILSGANLSRANLVGARLRGADLIAVDLTGATLREADLSATNLYQANLAGADLSRAVLRGANLTHASLAATNLRSADLSGAKLHDTDFRIAMVERTLFTDNDLRGAKNLETVQHQGPSSVGIDTIYRSQGKIPVAFLRGTGTPENFIEYMSSLAAPGAIQFYSCFISYSTKDQEFADRLYADLQNKGVRCWFAPHDIQGGKKLHEQIDEAIRRYERLLLILSPDSITSNWVEMEIRNARNRELKENKRVLFPVRLVSFDEIRDWKLFNADEGKDLATEIREYYIPDFSEWKNHDQYQKEFEKLLRALRTDGEKSA